MTASGHGIRLAVGRAPDTRKSGAAAVFMMNLKRRIALVIGVLISGLGMSATPARALDRLCDPSHEDCRAILINYIRNETQSIDVGFWFMEDARYTTELINRFKAGVKVRVIMDLRANDTNQFNAAATRRVAGRRHPDAAAHGERHHALQADALWRSGHRGVQRRQLQRRRVGVHHAVPELRRRVRVLHRQRLVRSQLHDQVRRPLDQHVVVHQLCERHRRADPDLPERLHQGSAAQLPAARVVREPGRRPVQQGDAEDRRDHVPDHGQAAHRRDDCGAQPRRPGPPDQRSAAVPGSDPLVGRVEHRPDVHGVPAAAPERPSAFASRCAHTTG